MYLSRDELEYFANEELRVYRNRCGEAARWKTDPIMLAGEVMGLNVEYHRLSPDYDVLGVTTGTAW